jgi:hypothetical protein
MTGDLPSGYLASDDLGTEIAELCTEAYRVVAPARLAAQPDA